MSRRRYFLFVFLLLVWVGACSKTPSPESAFLLLFEEQEPGTELQRTRMLVTQQFLRMDDGNDDGDYLLFDRANKTIYTTNSLDRRILVIKARPVELPAPEIFEHRVVKEDATYPAVNGRTVSHYRIFTNNERCYDVFVSKGLLPEAQQALREYRLALAGEQAIAAKYTPKEMQSGCDLANNVFLPTRHLEYGFPIRLEDMGGRSRRLLNYETNHKVEAKLFQLPQGYRRFTMDDMRTR